MFRIRPNLSGGQPLNINAWITNEDGSIYETKDLSEAEKLADDYNSEQKGRKGSDRMRYEVVDFDGKRGCPVIGRGNN